MDINVTHSIKKKRSSLQKFSFNIKKNGTLLLMTVPGMTLLLINSYLPMFGVSMAFVDFKYISNNYIVNLFTSKFIGFKNFEYIVTSNVTLLFTRNTLLYNIGFIILGLLTAIPVAIALNEVKNRALTGIYQSVMFLPSFFSWVVVAYVVYTFLDFNKGFINKSIIIPLGLDPIGWYNDPKYWPFIFPVVSTWKGLGGGVILYLASITSIDPELYQAAVMDGAGKLKQIRYITIPHLLPLIGTLTLLAMGHIFSSDFGMFFQLTGNSGLLYQTTLVIDTYVYNAFRLTGDVGMSTAAGLLQATLGFICIVGTNLIVRRFDKSVALF